LSEVRAAQAASLRTQGWLLAVVAFLVLLVAGAWTASVAAKLGLGLIVGGVVLAVALVVTFAWFLPRRRVGDDARTAKTLASQLPELNLDLLAAVELSKALGAREDFSPELARAFLRDVDAKAARLSVAKLIDQKPTKRAAMLLVITVMTLLVVLGFRGPTLRDGLAKALSVTGAAPVEALRREPITGDIEITYRYPAHTGLDVRVIPSSTGDVSAPAGTEVTIKTRADREVEGAALVFTPSKKRVPMRLDKRELVGSFIVEESGNYHVAFLEDDELVAEGPDQSITVEADQVPQARITSPLDGLELDPSQQGITVKFEASDDYGLSALELVYTPEGGEPKRVSLRPDDGRTTRGSYQWDLAPLALKPGQVVSYYVEATDNDAVKGPKKGVSQTLRVKLYSAAEHRREALKKAEELWGRLVDHLAERMEGSDRRSPTTVDSAVAGKPVDERAAQLAADFNQLALDLLEQKDPPEELLAALQNIASETNAAVSNVSAQRRVLLRIAGREATPVGKRAQLVDGKDGPFVQDMGRRVSAAIAEDIRRAEKNVLYLEALLDRAKLDSIRELAKQLREDRQELSKLLEEFGRTKDPAIQERLMEQMQALKQRMLELQQRMAEMSKGIRDDFMNAEALQQMQEEFGLENSLKEVEQLLKEGKAEEALKKMQELAMQMDEFLENLDEASDRSDEESDPELAQMYEDFEQNLKETVESQEKLADKTRALRDKYREQQKERIARQGEQLKRELKQKLDELEKSWKSADGDRFGRRFDDALQDAKAARDNVQQSLDANDFDLASEAADRMEEKAAQIAAQAMEQRQRDELFNNPPEVRRESKQAADQAARDAKRAQEVAQKLRELFPPAGQQMNEGDRQQMNELARQQRQLQQQAAQLQQQMEAIGERAPIFNEDAQQQMEGVGQRMQGAGERLQGKDPARGFGEQQGAVQGLKGIQQAMQDAAQQQGNGKGKKGGMPMPIKRRGSGKGRGSQNEKVEIPDEDPNAAPRDFRKDVMDAMKQGAPDRYKDQNKKYYEELVK
jgi:hypothetical protein